MPEINPPNYNITELALSMHEFYTSLINAGFTTEQAFELVKAMMVKQG